MELPAHRVLLHKQLIQFLLSAKHIQTARVIRAFEHMPRELFIPPALRDEAYADKPLDIGDKQTASRPSVVGFMLEQMRLKATDRVLEIGTGCGFQTALLALLTREVFTIEVHEALALAARKRLTQLGFANISFRVGNGFAGWRDRSPFDAIVVSAAADHIPEKLVEQLCRRGRLVMPLGREEQKLVRVVRHRHFTEQEILKACQFVEMIQEE